MALVSITPVAALLPVLVKAIVREVGPITCRRRVVGKLRRDFRAMGPLPGITGPANVLDTGPANVLEMCCKNCQGCPMKDS